VIGNIICREIMKGNPVDDLLNEGFDDPDNFNLVASKMILRLFSRMEKIEKENQDLRRQQCHLTTAIESLVRLLASKRMKVEENGVFSQKPLDVRKFVMEMQKTDVLAKNQDQFEFLILEYLK